MKPLAAIAALILATPSLFAAADISIKVSSFPPAIRAGFPDSRLAFEVRNAGPDTAENVRFSATPTAPGCCDFPPTNIPPGQVRFYSVTIDAPVTAGPLTVTASVTSSTPDPNPADNSASQTLTVSTDPDLILSFTGPLTQDLGLPFPLAFYLANFSKSTAHDVDVSLDFPAGVGVRTLPAGCSSLTAGRIVCHLEALPPTSPAKEVFRMTLVAPPAWTEPMLFTATATEREPDFDPQSNTARLIIPLYPTVYVTSTANDGLGSLRQAILDANTICLHPTPCTIAFRIDEPSATPWKTIRLTSPLPIPRSPRLRIEGATQSGFFGDANSDGPEIEITGGGEVDGDGLVVTNCGVQVGNLAVNGFQGNGVSVIESPPMANCFPEFSTALHDLFVGTDPTGTVARPNLRGIGVAVGNGTTIYTARAGTLIRDCVISGNLRSGVFGVSGGLKITGSRIGVKAHADDPLPNGNAGVYVGLGGYGSDVSNNVIAFNGQMGVAVAAGVADVSVRRNRMWGNASLGIDVGLDGPTPAVKVVARPVLTLAHYDPATRQTIIEGDVVAPLETTFAAEVDVYANDAPDPSGEGEGQRPLGTARVSGALPIHFRLTTDGDLTGQFITATTTRALYVGFAKPAPEGTEQLFLTQTSEFSRAIEVR